ncbi:AMP-binding protein [Achromobacter denitrificans]
METPQYWVRADLSTAERIRAFEATPLAARGLPDSTYAFLARSCRQAPQATAIRYLRDPSCRDAPEDVSFGRLLERIHQTANLVRGEGLGADDVVSLLLPNTPQAQYALWGGQAAAVVNPINWMLEAEAIAAIVRAAGARMLMAYGGDPEIEIWDKVLRVAELCPQLQTIVRLGATAGARRRPARASWITTPSSMAIAATRWTSNAISSPATWPRCSPPGARRARRSWCGTATGTRWSAPG